MGPQLSCTVMLDYETDSSQCAKCTALLEVEGVIILSYTELPTGLIRPRPLQCTGRASLHV